MHRSITKGSSCPICHSRYTIAGALRASLCPPYLAQGMDPADGGHSGPRPAHGVHGLVCRRWLPDREQVIGDRTYATLRLLAACQDMTPLVTVLFRLRLDAVSSMIHARHKPHGMSRPSPRSPTSWPASTMSSGPGSRLFPCPQQGKRKVGFRAVRRPGSRVVVRCDRAAGRWTRPFQVSVGSCAPCSGRPGAGRP